MTTVDTKACNKCGQITPLAGFPLDKRKTDGRQGICRKCSNIRTAEYDRRNPEKAYARTKAWRERNKEQFNAKRREWKKTESGQQSSRKWIDENRERVYLYNRARKAMRRGMRKTVTIEWINRLMKLQRGKCAACEIDLSGGYHVDHIYSIAGGGDSSPENLQLLCPSCNCSKKALHPVEFMQRMGRLL